MNKAPDAFRTISEVAEWLEVQAHVLRFWESKFSQVKPVKRAGGRRYYRPNDMLLIGGIKSLLHGEGMTIKGVQKILREKGVEHVSSLSKPLIQDPVDTGATVEATAVEEPAATPMADAPQEQVQDVAENANEVTPVEPTVEETGNDQADAEPANVLTFQSRMSRREAEPVPDAPEPETQDTETPETETEQAGEVATDTPTEEPAAAVAQPSLPLEEEAAPDQPHLPSFLHRSARPAAPPEPPVAEPDPEPETVGPPKARVVEALDPPPEEEIAVRAGPLGRLARLKALAATDVPELTVLAAEIRALVAARASAHDAAPGSGAGPGHGADPTAGTHSGLPGSD